MRFVFVILIIDRIVNIVSEMESKIVGGDVVKNDEFAHAAFLIIQCQVRYDERVLSWICGSSILNQNLLLTAAHCLVDCTRNSWVSVSVGSNRLDTETGSSAYSYLIHQDFVYDSPDNDIGLVKLKTPLELNSMVKRVALMKEPPYKETAQVAGWGLADADEDGTVAEQLKFVNQYVWRRNECLRLLEEMPRGTICASSGSEEDYIAEGDSGSALVARGYVQLGIVSYKRPAKSRSVVIYTDVGYFYDWIKQNAKLLYCDEGIRI
ncbi:chymotrypsin-1-like isoform X2 [Anticarsia gemmatalis]|uniref:chymotrypsin-1-like isoform X2 n=1 Tax=Anticarsia gemmatalis TaxID=129554 RepID=UPI003F759615